MDTDEKIKTKYGSPVAEPRERVPGDLRFAPRRRKNGKTGNVIHGTMGGPSIGGFGGEGGGLGI